MTAGYYRYPTIHGDTVVFLSEDDLWSVPVDGGVARRLTSSLGPISRPRLSPDGSLVAFTSMEEGHSEICVMPSEGGGVTRRTFLGALSLVAGWRPDGESILLATNYAQPFERILALASVPTAGGHVSPLPYGPAHSISFGPDGQVALGRHSVEIAYWKRYRGGRAGVLWVDPRGDGQFRQLIELPGNLAHPMWIGERIYFLSDHEGIGNIYSCQPSGEDLQRHTDCTDLYGRNPTTDGTRIVYHVGGELRCFEPPEGRDRQIDVTYHSPRVQRNRKFVTAERFLEEYQVHPEGHTTLAITRGKPYAMGHWEGAVRQYGTAQGVRYRMGRYLRDGEQLLLISDACGEEQIELHTVEPPVSVRRLEGLDLGRACDLQVSPKANQAALANHRNELLLVDLDEGTARRLDHSPHSRVQGLSWSPDGRWLAYALFMTQHTCSIKLYDLSSDSTHLITPPKFRDVAPNWDPEGKYLYFLSYRIFDPIYDNQFFELSFPRGMLPYLVTLKADTPSPFVAVPKSPGGKPRKSAAQKGDEEENGENGENAEQKGDKQKQTANGGEVEIEIDLDGIGQRIVAFPVKEGKFGRVCGLRGKALFSRFPIEGALSATNWRSSQPPAKGQLECYDFEKQTHEVLLSKLTDFEVTLDRKVLIYRSGRKLRVIKAGEKPSPKEGLVRANRETGYLSLRRIKVEVDPPQEWAQMFREAWRLQREHFWTENMSLVDWEAVRDRYTPVIDRISSRREFSDLILEIQGELGTSHAYEMGGDHRAIPRYQQGHLGADMEYDSHSGLYQITRIVNGDVWDTKVTSSLNRPGIGVSTGQTLLAVNGQPVARDCSPLALLVNTAGEEVELTIGDDSGENPRNITVKTLRSEHPARYRDWVERNQQRVLEATDGQVGYLHVPNMGPKGFSEFHRSWSSQLDRHGLIVDVRYNGGGHVSQLLLEKLARKRLGYNIQRWGSPTPYPRESVPGPMIALTNESAGSDGDIFSHCFKLLSLGPLIGKRTWGGVIGIWPRYRLVDGGLTTQPEYSFWFKDVRWGVENHGTNPDIEVDIAPQDYAEDRDPQLERAITEALQRLDDHPPLTLDFGDRPNLTLPELPPRN